MRATIYLSFWILLGSLLSVVPARADLLAAADPNQDKTDDDYRGRLMSLAVAYDWLHADLSEARREQYRRAIAAHVERQWYFAQRTNFVSGHPKRRREIFS